MTLTDGLTAFRKLSAVGPVASAPHWSRPT